MNTPTSCLAICELFNPVLHGITVNSSSCIQGQFLVHSSFTMEEFMEGEWTEILDMMKTQYASYPDNYKTHPYIRNYKNFIDNKYFFKLDIIQMIELPGGETVGIIKTTGLKRFQRLCKRKCMKN